MSLVQATAIRSLKRGSAPEALEQAGRDEVIGHILIHLSPQVKSNRAGK